MQFSLDIGWIFQNVLVIGVKSYMTVVESYIESNLHYDCVIFSFQGTPWYPVRETTKERVKHTTWFCISFSGSETKGFRIIVLLFPFIYNVVSTQSCPMVSSQALNLLGARGLVSPLPTCVTALVWWPWQWSLLLFTRHNYEAYMENT